MQQEKPHVSDAASFSAFPSSLVPLAHPSSSLDQALLNGSSTHHLSRFLPLNSLSVAAAPAISSALSSFQSTVQVQGSAQLSKQLVPHMEILFTVRELKESQGPESEKPSARSFISSTLAP